MSLPAQKSPDEALMLDRISLEGALNMEGWGYWGYERNNALGFRVPSWVKQMKTVYQRDNKKPVRSITDDYGLLLDGLMAGIAEPARTILYMRYVLKAPFAAIRREVGCSNQVIEMTIISTMSYLRGCLKK